MPFIRMRKKVWNHGTCSFYSPEKSQVFKGVSVVCSVYLSYREAARELETTAMTIRKKVLQGKLPHMLLNGDRPFVNQSVLRHRLGKNPFYYAVWLGDSQEGMPPNYCLQTGESLLAILKKHEGKQLTVKMVPERVGSVVGNEEFLDLGICFVAVSDRYYMRRDKAGIIVGSNYKEGIDSKMECVKEWEEIEFVLYKRQHKQQTRVLMLEHCTVEASEWPKLRQNFLDDRDKTLKKYDDAPWQPVPFVYL